ncbi:MAG: PA2779 family protein, partial [Candidatus Omnitrophica bacterium]|nr:PA2779 family protein [Candidatus Omnitrophota bacterium]
AFAMPTESVSVLQTASAREAQIEKIMEVLSHPRAQLHLRMAGISRTELQEGLWKLDDAQLAMVAQKADAVKAGGQLLGLVIALLVIAILIVVLMMLLRKDIRIKDKEE